MARHLLLMSSSKVGDSSYLEQNLPLMTGFLEKCIANESSSNSNKKILFIPFAGVSKNYNDYLTQVKDVLEPNQLTVESIHEQPDFVAAIKQAQAILVGGGNTFHLLHQLYQYDLLGVIRERVVAGTPYLGWSAGANIATPSIHTTNDMPIIYPPSFTALNLVGFQLNPHYFDQHPPGFNGETRDDRLKEFLTLQPHANVVGLPEGNAIEIHDDRLTLHEVKKTQLLNQSGKISIDTKMLQQIYMETMNLDD